MSMKLCAAFGLGVDRDEPEVAMAAHRRHFDDVVATTPTAGLVIWRAADGWEPRCAALGIVSRR
jgi:hypothetical protein